MDEVRNCDVVAVRDTIPSPYADRRPEDLVQADPTPDHVALWASSGNGDTTDPMLGALFRGRPQRLRAPRMSGAVSRHPQSLRLMTGGWLDGLDDVPAAALSAPVLVGLAVGLWFLFGRNRS